MATSITVTGTPLEVQPPASPDVCRMGADFVGVDGLPRVNLRVKFSFDYSHVEVQDFSILGPERTVATDANGHLEVDLMRGVGVHCHLPGRHDLALPFTVPDLATADLFDYLFPRVSSVALTPATMALAVGGTEEGAATATLSDGRTVDVAGAVTWASSDELVATVSTGGLVTAVAAGTANISVSALVVTGIEEIWDPTTQAPFAILPTPVISYGAAIGVTVT